MGNIGDLPRRGLIGQASPDLPFPRKRSGDRQVLDHRKYVYSKTRDIVHDKWVKLHQLAKAGPMVKRVPTLAQFLTYWLAEIVKPHLAPATYVSYEGFTRLYIVPGIGAKRLDHLQVKEVQTWIHQVARTCQCCAPGKDAARVPAKRRCCAVGQCCNAVPSAARSRASEQRCGPPSLKPWRKSLVSKNVAALVKLRVARKKPGKAWDSDEARRFLEAAHPDEDPMYAAWVLILVLGLGGVNCWVSPGTPSTRPPEN